MRIAIVQLHIAFALALLILQSGCAQGPIEGESNETYNRNPLTVPIPKGFDDASAVDAAEAALIKRHWEIISKTADAVTGTLQDKYRNYTVAVKNESGTLVLYSDSVYFVNLTDVYELVPLKELREIRGDIHDALSRDGD